MECSFCGKVLIRPRFFGRLISVGDVTGGPVDDDVTFASAAASAAAVCDNNNDDGVWAVVAVARGDCIAVL